MIKEIFEDYFHFLDIAPINQVILVGLFFALAFIFSIFTFFLPLKFEWFYKKMENYYNIFQVSAFLFYVIFAWRVNSLGINPHLYFLVAIALVNAFFNWWLYDRVTRDSAKRLQFQKNGISAIEISSTLKDIKKEKKKQGADVGIGS